MKQLRLTILAIILAGVTAACSSSPYSGSSPATLWQATVEIMTQVKAFHFLMITVLNDGEVFTNEGDLVLPDRLTLTSQVRQGAVSLPASRTVYIGDTMWQASSAGRWTQSVVPIATWQRAAFSNGIILTALGERLRQANAPTDLGVTVLDDVSVRHLRLVTTFLSGSHVPMDVWIDPNTGYLKQLWVLSPSLSPAITGTVTVKLSQINSTAITINTPMIKP